MGFRTGLIRGCTTLTLVMPGGAFGHLGSAILILGVVGACVICLVLFRVISICEAQEES
jgi:hypothetical protein